MWSSNWPNGAAWSEAVRTLRISMRDLASLADPLPQYVYVFSMGSALASCVVFGAPAEHTFRSARRRPVQPRRLRSPSPEQMLIVKCLLRQCTCLQTSVTPVCHGRHSRPHSRRARCISRLPRQSADWTAASCVGVKSKHHRPALNPEEYRHRIAASGNTYFVIFLLF